MTTLRLRRRWKSPPPIVLAGAHDGLSARLVARAGFDGVWASGFEISASRGVPDASLLTMTEHLAAAREMVESCDVPVLADCDTGFGDALNVKRAARAFEAAGVAGVCIEDSAFPKRCSFYRDVRRRLAPPEEHALKVRACCDARRGEDFLVVARTEALIAGWPLEEALARARAYADAGADAVLVHSRARDAAEVAAFARRWDRPQPLVCVPTTYADASVADLAAIGFEVVIFANQGLRLAVKAMADGLALLRSAGRAAALDGRLASLGEVDRLVGVDELRADEEAYLAEPVPGAAAGGEGRGLRVAAGGRDGP